MAGTDDDLSTKLPLDSPLWRPIEEVYDRLCPLIGNRHLVAQDLTKVQATGDVRTMRRWLLRRFRRGGWSDRRPCDHRLWLVWFELSSWSDGLLVVYRLRGAARGGFHQVRRLRGYAFYCWGPDLARIWPAVFASTPPSPTAPILDPQPQAPASNTSLADTGSQPVRSLPDPEEWLVPIREKFFRLPRKHRSNWLRGTAYPQMQHDFGDRPPWDSWESLRRAMYPHG
jgi:hypothetical protein